MKIFDKVRWLLSDDEEQEEYPEPLLDIGLAVDHTRRVFQIQLYATPYPDMDIPMIASVYPQDRFSNLLQEMQVLLMRGYQPIDGEVLPSETEKMLEKYR